MVGVTDVVDVTVTLRNRGEDSYGTTVQLHHAAALSYRKAVVLQVTPPQILQRLEDPPQVPKTLQKCIWPPKALPDALQTIYKFTWMPNSPPDVLDIPHKSMWPPEPSPDVL